MNLKRSYESVIYNAEYAVGIFYMVQCFQYLVTIYQKG